MRWLRLYVRRATLEVFDRISVGISQYYLADCLVQLDLNLLIAIENIVDKYSAQHIRVFLIIQQLECFVQAAQSHKSNVELVVLTEFLIKILKGEAEVFLLTLEQLVHGWQVEDSALSDAYFFVIANV